MAVVEHAGQVYRRGGDQRSGQGQLAEFAAVVECLAERGHTRGIPGADIKSGEFFALIEKGSHIGDTSRIPAVSVQPCEFFALAEHPLHGRHVSCVEMGEIKGGQFLAAVEHAGHVRHAGGVPAGEVQTCQIGFAAAGRTGFLEVRVKHLTHARNMRGIPAAQIQRGRGGVAGAGKHAVHLRYAGGVQMFQPRDFRNTVIRGLGLKQGGAVNRSRDAALAADVEIIPVAGRAIGDPGHHGPRTRFPRRGIRDVPACHGVRGNPRRVVDGYGIGFFPIIGAVERAAVQLLDFAPAEHIGALQIGGDGAAAQLHVGPPPGGVHLGIGDDVELSPLDVKCGMGPAGEVPALPPQGRGLQCHGSTPAVERVVHGGVSLAALWIIGDAIAAPVERHGARRRHRLPVQGDGGAGANRKCSRP